MPLAGVGFSIAVEAGRVVVSLPVSTRPRPYALAVVGSLKNSTGFVTKQAVADARFRPDGRLCPPELEI